MNFLEASKWVKFGMTSLLASFLCSSQAVYASNHDCNNPLNVIANCGFESGDFSGWQTSDILFPPLGFELQVNVAGIDRGPAFGFFDSAPTEGSYAVLHGFDGVGPGTIELAQDVALPDNVTELEFDYRLAWDYTAGAVATQDRVFRVQIEPSGGGAPLQTTDIFTAPVSTLVNQDSGELSGIVDLQPFAGQSVRINFLWLVPENYTGVAFFQLDNVLARVVASEPQSVPVDSPLLLWLMSLALGGIALRAFRRS